MIKNNKGFTLVELLTAVIILGILMAVAAPTVLNMISNNKKKMYVDVAKRLIAQAEYQIKVNNSTITKPDPGNVIIISLVYLDGDDFDSTPDGGQYVKEASFVVVKNNGNSLEYSVRIIEKLKKDGYYGVDLTSNNSLLKKDAAKNVKNFNENDLVFALTEENKGENISNSELDAYISSKFSGSSIDGVYNYRELANNIID